ncbi:hypothetical protein PsorP6_002513 [Peronosclerospora sorghi]|uniref:Uncharacterized protein n=1 Tax=Peronosclerospora sorghi TaxID=230839 RepID=A0ACC0WSX9_9STRA|nr:hypothetical protein PsorP6_002513 [Peronosclerospora sorghi]
MMHRCMAHVLNLIARDGLHEFGLVEDDEDNVEETYIMRKTILPMTESLDDYAKFHLTKVEWDKMEKVCNFLAPPHWETNEICALNFPTLSKVIPLYSSLWHWIEKVHSTYGAIQIQPVAVAMHSKLKKYVKLAFQQDANYFATILDPRWDIGWFRDSQLWPNIFWTMGHSPDAIDLLFTEAADKFKKLSEEATSPPPPLANNTLEAMMEEIWRCRTSSR